LLRSYVAPNEYCYVALQYKFLASINILSVRDVHDKPGVYLFGWQDGAIASLARGRK
jgi:hypothetical protein